MTINYLDEIHERNREINEQETAAAQALTHAELADRLESTGTSQARMSLRYRTEAARRLRLLSKVGPRT